MKIIIHIGLHKTGTTYLQHYVFPFLRQENIIYNPKDIFYFINAIFTLDIKDIDFLEKARSFVQEYGKNNSNDTLFISSEGISQLSFYQNYEEQVESLKYVFPNAEVILSLREQSKWLESCYKESIKHHSYQFVESFLNYKNGEFVKCNVRFDEDGCFKMDVNKANWLNLYKLISEKFDSVNLFFYENFKKDRLGQTNQILEIIGEEKLDSLPDVYVNQGISKESLDILVKFNKFKKLVGLKSKTYAHSWRLERNNVLEHDVFWTQSKPHFIYRAIRALHKEPARILRRVSLRNILKKVDSFYYGKKQTPISNDDLRLQIQKIHKHSNIELSHLIKDMPKEYIYE